MSNYRVWESKDSSDILVEVFNEHDVVGIQNYYTAKGWIVVSTAFMMDCYFIKLRKAPGQWKEEEVDE